MQRYFLIEDERERQRRFPEDIPPHDVSDYFTLSEADRRECIANEEPTIGWVLPCSSARCVLLALPPTNSRRPPSPWSAMSPSNSVRLPPV